MCYSCGSQSKLRLVLCTVLTASGRRCIRNDCCECCDAYGVGSAGFLFASQRPYANDMGRPFELTSPKLILNRHVAWLDAPCSKARCSRIRPTSRGRSNSSWANTTTVAWIFGGEAPLTQTQMRAGNSTDCGTILRRAVKTVTQGTFHTDLRARRVMWYVSLRMASRRCSSK
jgi:hypothetical protein